VNRIVLALLAILAAAVSADARSIESWPYDDEPGSIVIITSERRLYYVLGEGEAIAYDIAVGREGEQWTGTKTVVRKAKWPAWYPTQSMKAKNRRLPDMVKGGPKNPLGARAIYLSDSLLRIHGTNDPSSIGKAASSGCFRMYNEDVAQLYEFVGPGTQVTIAQ
jgi:lipoprotein-anchoring transpeptidase ErfK/SrfK